MCEQGTLAARLSPAARSALWSLKNVFASVSLTSTTGPPVMSATREVPPLDDRNPHRRQVRLGDGLEVVDVLERPFGTRACSPRSRRRWRSPAAAAAGRSSPPPTARRRSPTAGRSAAGRSRRGSAAADTARPGSTRPNVTSWLRLKPASTVVRFQRLRSSRPAPITSTTASATSSITSPLRSRARAAPAVDRCPASFSEMLTTRSRSCSSGAMPKSTPVTSETSNVKPSTPDRARCPRPAAGCPDWRRASPSARRSRAPCRARRRPARAPRLRS